MGKLICPRSSLPLSRYSGGGPGWGPFSRTSCFRPPMRTTTPRAPMAPPTTPSHLPIPRRPSRPILPRMLHRPLLLPLPITAIRPRPKSHDLPNLVHRPRRELRRLLQGHQHPPLELLVRPRLED